ncbi:Uncharacterised protein [Mycobacteroides abscessus subsp. abscessus]|nr:Uncharacterised protein [Mycobacteroides abscessus subsp. abscessus]
MRRCYWGIALSSWAGQGSHYGHSWTCPNLVRPISTAVVYALKSLPH